MLLLSMLLPHPALAIQVQGRSSRGQTTPGPPSRLPRKRARARVYVCTRYVPRTYFGTVRYGTYVLRTEYSVHTYVLYDIGQRYVTYRPEVGPFGNCQSPAPSLAALACGPTASDRRSPPYVVSFGSSLLLETPCSASSRDLRHAALDVVPSSICLRLLRWSMLDPRLHRSSKGCTVNR